MHSTHVNDLFAVLTLTSDTFGFPFVPTIIFINTASHCIGRSRLDGHPANCTLPLTHLISCETLLYYRRCSFRLSSHNSPTSQLICTRTPRTSTRPALCLHRIASVVFPSNPTHCLHLHYVATCSLSLNVPCCNHCIHGVSSNSDMPSEGHGKISILRFDSRARALCDHVHCASIAAATRITRGTYVVLRDSNKKYKDRYMIEDEQG